MSGVLCLLLQLLLGLVPLLLSLATSGGCLAASCAHHHARLEERLDLAAARTSMPIGRGRTPVSSDPFGISASGMTPSESGIGLTVVKQMLYSCV